MNIFLLHCEQMRQFRKITTRVNKVLLNLEGEKKKVIHSIFHLLPPLP